MSSPKQGIWLMLVCLTVAAEASAQYRFDTWTTELIKAADEALYRAKAAGRNQIAS